MASGEPPEKDMKEFEFVQLCKFRVTDPGFKATTERSLMLACSSVFGLVFYATKTGFNVVKTSDLLAVDEATGIQRNKVTVEDFPILTKVTLPSPASYLSVSGDGALLFVIYMDTDQINAVFYDLHGFADKTVPAQPFAKLPSVVNPGVNIVDVAWNPAIFSMLAVCYSDGTMVLFNINDNPHAVANLPSSVGASCLSWSPKGKQLLMGKKDGSLSQYDHALTEKKKWACPTVFTSGQMVVDVVWLSTYTFIAAYRSIGAQDSEQPMVVLTNSNKEGNTSYTNFDDVCFSSSEDQKPQYLFHNVQKWEVVLMASSRATEATLVGKNLDDKTSWEHWNLEDSARAELPLTSDQCDSFPLGMTVDYSPQGTVTLSEIKSFPACPVMFLLSSDGLLLAYHLHYSHKEAAQITMPPQPLNPAKARKGVPGLIGKTVSSYASSPAQLQQQPTAAVKPSFPTMKPPVASAAPTATDFAKTPLNSFSFASGGSPAAPAFQFGKTADVPAAEPGSSAINQKQPLLATPTAPSQQAQGVQGQSAGASSFSFTLGGPTSKLGQSSAFASIPPSQPVSSTAAATGLKFGQPSSTSIFGAPTSVAKPSMANTTPFLAPNGMATPSRQTTPPATVSPLQQTIRPAGGPAVGLGASSIFSLKKPHEDGTGRVQQQSPSTISKPQQQQPLAPPPAYPQQQPPPPSSLFGGAAKPVAAPLSIGRPVAGGGFAGKTAAFGNGITGDAQPGVVGGGQIAQMKAGTGRGVVDHGASIEATVDSAFSRTIAEEISHFEEEMKKLRLRSKRDIKTVGTKAEMQCLRHNTEETVDFLSNIKDTVKDHLHEVQDLKSNYFNLFADVEKSSTQLQRNSNPHYHSLLQGRALDPASAEQLRNIQQMAQVLEQTLSEVNHTLNSEWDQHMTQKSRQSRVIAPTGDSIYKAIKNNHQLISYQRRSLEKLEDKMCSLRLSSKELKKDRSVLSLVAEDTPSASSKQEFFCDSKKQLTLRDAVSKGMTPEKVSRIKDILCQHRVPVIKPRTPVNLSMSTIVSSTPRRPATSSPASKSAGQLQQQQRGQTPSQPSQQQSLFGNVGGATYQNTPTGIPNAELRLQKGQLSSTDVPKPAAQDFRFTPPQQVPSSPSTPSIFGSVGNAGTVSGGNVQWGGQNMQQGQQKPPPMGPTSFSGVAYFKQPSPQAQMPPPSSSTSARVGPSPQSQHYNSADVKAAREMLTKYLGSGGVLNLPAMLSAENAESAESGKNIYQNLQQQYPQEAVYEDITPTETDETNEDDEEDYEEEDNGYEDEDEEEYEEEEGFDQSNAFGVNVAGKTVSFFPVKTTPTNINSGTSSLQQANISSSSTPGGSTQQTPTPFTGFGNTATGPAISKNLFGGKASTSPPSTTMTVTTVAAASSGFTFGNAGNLFGQKAATTSLSTSSTSAPGQALSDLTGAADNSVSSTSVSSIFGGTSSGSKFAFGTSTSTASTTAATASGSTGFNFTAMASNSSSSIFGGVKTTTALPCFTGTEKKANPDPTVDKTKVSSPTVVTTNTTSAPQKSPVISSSTDSTSTDGSGVVSSSSASPLGVKQPSNTQVSSLFGGGETNATTAVTGTSVTTPSAVGFGGGSSGIGFSLPTSITPAPSAAAAVHDSDNTKSVSSAQSSIFGGNDTVNVSSGKAITTTATPLFGNGSTVATTPLIFGNGSTASSSAPLFGGAATTTTTSSIFGSNATSTTTTPLFGGNSTPSSTSLFGGSSSVATSLPSLFSSNNAAAITSSSFFGAGNVTSTTAAPLFGGTSGTSSSTSLFGSPATTSAPTIFGATTTTPFGSSTTAAPAFGSKPETTSPFFGGANATTTTTSSIFGGGNGSSGGSTFSFNTQPSDDKLLKSMRKSFLASGKVRWASLPSIVGDNKFIQLYILRKESGYSWGIAVTGSTFGTGFGNNQNSTTGSSSFSFSNQPSSNSSGGGGAASLFGGFGGLGAKPSEEKANTNVFGSPQTFGSPTTQNNLFGSGNSSSPFGGGTFGGTGNSFSGGDTGSFSSGGGGVASTGFGVSNNPASSAGGFGSSPAFGNAPSFGGGATGFGGGAKPGFGSPSIFGGSPSFGGSSSTGSFGSSAGTGGVFGSGAGNNTASEGFGSFAASSAPSFGQLAQTGGNSSGGSGFGAGALSSPFGNAGVAGNSGGGFGTGAVFGQSPAGGAGSGGGFGSASPGGFGNQTSGFGSSPAFSSYRG